MGVRRRRDSFGCEDEPNSGRLSDVEFPVELPVPARHQCCVRHLMFRVGGGPS